MTSRAEGQVKLHIQKRIREKDREMGPKIKQQQQIGRIVRIRQLELLELLELYCIIVC